MATVAVEAVKGAVQGTEEIINAAVARSKQVMMRQWAVYDSEKVFWNSVWTVGLVGLGWAAVKLGLMIRGISNTISTISDYVTDLTKPSHNEGFQTAYDYTWGKNKDATIPSVSYAPWDVNKSVGYIFARELRAEGSAKPEDSALWRQLQEKYKSDHGVYFVPDTPQVDTPGDVLDLINKFFDTYGPVLPFAAILGHMGLESVRVYRTRKKLGAEM